MIRPHKNFAVPAALIIKCSYRTWPVTMYLNVSVLDLRFSQRQLFWVVTPFGESPTFRANLVASIFSVED
jgi:hypothetical protein